MTQLIGGRIEGEGLGEEKEPSPMNLLRAWRDQWKRHLDHPIHHKAFIMWFARTFLWTEGHFQVHGVYGRREMGCTFYLAYSWPMSPGEVSPGLFSGAVL